MADIYGVVGAVMGAVLGVTATLTHIPLGWEMHARRRNTIATQHQHLCVRQPATTQAQAGVRQREQRL